MEVRQQRLRSLSAAAVSQEPSCQRAGSPRRWGSPPERTGVDPRSSAAAGEGRTPGWLMGISEPLWLGTKGGRLAPAQLSGGGSQKWRSQRGRRETGCSHAQKRKE